MAVYEIEGPDGKVYTVEGPAEGGPAGQMASPSPAVSAATETAKTLGAGIYGGLTSIPRAIGAAGDWLEKKFPTPEWTKTPVPGGKVIGETDEAIRQALHPETKPGQVASRVLEAGVGALMGPGGLAAPVRSAVVGLSSGAGAEVGRAVDPENPLLALAGGLLGGGVGSVATMAKTNKELLAREALKNVSPKDLAIAKQRQVLAEQAGIPINLSQAMPQASNIDTMVEALASSRHGTKVTDQLRKQPSQIAFGVEDQLAQIPGQIRMPQVLANNAQEAAGTAVRSAMEQATKAWQKFAPTKATIPETALSNFDAQLKTLAAKYPNTAQADLVNDVRRAIKTAESVPKGGSPIVGPNGQLINPPVQGPTYLTEALQVKGAIDDVLQNFGARKLNTPGLQGKELRRAQEVRQLFRDVIDSEVPELARANRAYEAIYSGVVDPLKRSVVGRLAGRAGADAATEAPQARLFSVFNRGTVPGATSSEILTLEKSFRKVGEQEVFLDAAKSWVADKVSQALKSEGNRLPEDIGSRLQHAFGDPRNLTTTSKGFSDLLAGVARSQGIKDEAAYVKGFKNFMEVVADASRRPSSAKGLSAGEARELAGSGISRRLGNLSVMTPLRQPALRWAAFLESNALGEMDRLLTSSQGIDTLIKLGKQPKYSHLSISAMATFLGTAANAQAETSVNNPPDITTD